MAETVDTKGVFRRLLGLLRPYRGAIGVALVFLVVSAPCELFPGIAWGFITDDIVLKNPRSPWLRAWFSFGGRVSNPFQLLLSATAWMFVVYLVGELFGTLETWVLNRVAQKFILGFRNCVYRKL